VDFVRAVGQAQGAGAGVGAGQEAVFADAERAVDLDGAVDHLERHVRCGDLDHADRRAGTLGAEAVERVRGVQGEQPRLFDFQPRVRDRFAHHALFGQRPMEGDPAAGASAHGRERAFGHADQTHAVVDAARAESALGDFEAAAKAGDQVFDWHFGLLEQHFGMALRGVVEAE